MTVTEDLEQLAEKADDMHRELTAIPLLSVARGLLNETQILRRHDQLERARKAVRDAPDIIRARREALQSQQDRLRQTVDAFEQAVAQAEWALDARFVAESATKVFLITRHRVEPGQEPNDAWTFIEDAAGASVYEERRQMTADERATWKKRTALAAREVQPAKQAKDSAEQAVAMARVDVEFADDQWKAARAELDAARTDADLAIAQLACLARALGGDR